MSHLALIFLLVVGAILILVLVAIAILISNGSKKSSSVTKKRTNSKTSFRVPMPKTYSLYVPPAIEKMGTSLLKEISRKIFDSYKTFNYKDKRVSELDAKEWHSWQVSILLAVFKRSEDILVYDQETLFHKFILDSDENDIKRLMTGIIKKYEAYVDFHAQKDDLCKHYIWSSREVSVIFYFLANYKDYAK
ncbi:hypothetical protein CRV08_10185 [Halarcobacter ebronensis]|uniref:Uncharacterized protein n=1 Tax=Halarcobacter ebronensis TaxID=1462615 RepID=A0A4Q0YBK0_9BACT|nr:hypothetical protein [Halarcobacter ebronensis]RXJ67727.1 hypothetical protein CRV08_10185 [Halarcobacter ebronensis]